MITEEEKQPLLCTRCGPGSLIGLELKFGLEFAAVKDESVTLREKKARFRQSQNSEPCMLEVRAGTQARNSEMSQDA